MNAQNQSQNRLQRENAELDAYLGEGDNRQRYAQLYRRYARDQRGWSNLSQLSRRLAVRANASRNQ